LSGVNKEKDIVLPKTTVEISKNKKGDFIGKVNIYDTFVTRKPLVLNFYIEQTLCEKNSKSILLFRISPQNYDHQVWGNLKSITVMENSCN
jgi:hypothetical protein